ncbi:hypothetical protein SAMN05660649_00160 [Desulfotomaculum arcticum]|uniref:Uncharacterized protein n=1 Tax=Desulfotruncus arcticus DSM 17038 TaxID=1121424 RepID=A0A1I2MUC5_9FIRM|nr:hypothetical protein [Desulfotruncus arcticus]SFF95033.1 hypothetical protein SAMN05660649_00160 [Desulfotomaculum arcticum] [Desulfotruncus arcticus DSM 17038]
MSELESILRRVLDEVLDEKLNDKLLPINERLIRLEKGQHKLQQDVSIIKKDVKDDIIRLDNRLTKQEEKTNIL